MTEDQKQAIRQFLQKPPRMNGACGCMGPAYLKPFEVVSKFKYGLWEYNANDYEPFCRCAMSNVELINGVYYEVQEVVDLEALVTRYQATIIGPVGGPYSVDRNGNAITEQPITIVKKTAADRIKELQGNVPPKAVTFQERIELVNKMALDPANYGCTSWAETEPDGTWTKTEIIDNKFVVTPNCKRLW